MTGGGGCCIVKKISTALQNIIAPTLKLSTPSGAVQHFIGKYVLDASGAAAVQQNVSELLELQRKFMISFICPLVFAHAGVPC